jgi:NADH:ubiquinone oxidoreductase subunit F (NADH-binding)
VNRPKIRVAAGEPVVLGAISEGPVRSLASYTTQGGYQTFEQALNQQREDLLHTVERSGLRGRGGAGFPTGRKWRAVADCSETPKYVVANADEGDPGAYIDRFLIEESPHRLIEAMAIAGYAVGADKGYIYLRREYPAACAVMSQALEEARSAGVLGRGIFQSDFAFEVELVIGSGSYICGEETALLKIFWKSIIALPLRCHYSRSL